MRADGQVFSFDVVSAVAFYFMQCRGYYLPVNIQAIGKYLLATSQQQGIGNSFQVLFISFACLKINYLLALFVDGINYPVVVGFFLYIGF